MDLVGNIKGNALWSFYYDVGNNKALCQICKKHISFKGVTTFNLKRHLQRVHSVNIVCPKNSTECQNAIENMISSEPRSGDDEIGVIKEEIMDVERSTEGEVELDSLQSEYDKITKRKSSIWGLFTNLEENIAKCNFCEKLLSFKGGSTGNLARHIRNKHNKFKDVITTEDHCHYTAPIKNAPCYEILEDKVKIRNFTEEVNIKQCQLLNLDLEIKGYEAKIARTELEIAKVKLDLLTAGFEID